MRKLLALLMLSIFFFLIFGQIYAMRIKGDERFGPYFTDWRFQAEEGGILKIYANGQVTKIYENGKVVRIYRKTDNFKFK